MSLNIAPPGVEINEDTIARDIAHDIDRRPWLKPDTILAIVADAAWHDPAGVRVILRLVADNLQEMARGAQHAANESARLAEMVAKLAKRGAP